MNSDINDMIYKTIYSKLLG